MLFKINTRINNRHYELLRNLVNHELRSILITETGDLSLVAVLNIDNRYITIQNIPKEQLDQDEYTNLNIQEFKPELYTLKKLVVCKKIERISTVYDAVSWRQDFNEWNVESDIALIITINEYCIIINAIDSLAGFLKIITIQKSAENLDQLFKDQWGMKTDCLTSLERRIIDF